MGDDDPTGREGGSHKHVGDLVVKSDAFKSFAAGRGDKRAAASIRVPTDSLFVQKNVVVGDNANARVLAPYERAPIVTGVERRTWVMDAIPRSPTASAAVEYAVETATNNAGTQAAGSPLLPAEGALKNESSFAYTLQTRRVLTIAHFVKLSQQVLDDAAALAGVVANRLRYFLMVELDRQIVEGNGTSELTGLTTAGNHVALSGGQTGDTALDSIHRGITQLLDNDYTPSTVIMSPKGWQRIALLKDSQDRYIVGDPAAGNTRQVWGLPVTVSASMSDNAFLVCDLPSAAELRIRQEATVDFGYVNDDFIKNLVSCRCEMRCTLAVARPSGVVKGAFS
jgi:HK97 family phage major capsid protein